MKHFAFVMGFLANLILAGLGFAVMQPFRAIGVMILGISVVNYIVLFYMHDLTFKD